MLAVEFDTPQHAEEVQWACFQAGLLVLECGRTTVRLSPALTVSAAEVATAVSIFSKAVAAVAGERGEILAAAGAGGGIGSVEAGG
jgi:4-aminobutyrate aminotransferase